jgi:isoquinoline 1-oxidoreductase beta subunit
VLEKVAAETQWDRPLAEGRRRGISLQESFGTLVAQVVEVTVVDGDMSVDRVVAVIDAGFAISPDGITAQVESAARDLVLGPLKKQIFSALRNTL